MFMIQTKSYVHLVWVSIGYISVFHQLYSLRELQFFGSYYLQTFKFLSFKYVDRRGTNSNDNISVSDYCPECLITEVTGHIEK